MKIFQNKAFIIICSCIFPFAFLYTYDWPQSLSTPLQQYYHYSLQQVNLIYTFTVVGALFLCLKLGMIFDSFSIKITLVVVPSICALSQLFIALVFYLEISWNYYAVLACRIIFGISGDCLFMLQAMVLIKIFKEKSDKYIGYGMAIAMLGSPINSFLTPIIQTTFNNIYMPLLFSGSLCVIIVFVGLILSYIMKQHQQKEKQEKYQSLLTSSQITQINPLVNYEQTTKTTQNLPPPSLIDQIKTFSIQFWMIQIMIIFQNGLGSFISTGIDYLVKRFTLPYVVSGYLMILPYTISFIISFVIPFVPIKITNAFIVIPIFMIMGFTGLELLPNTQSPSALTYTIAIICLILLGTAYSGYVMKLIPAVNRTIKPQYSGAAYGVVSISYNISTVSIPYLSSLIVDSFSNQMIGYYYLTFFYIGISISCLIVAVYVKLSKFKQFQQGQQIKKV